jgi:hypothetical protein
MNRPSLAWRHGLRGGGPRRSAIGCPKVPCFAGEDSLRRARLLAGVRFRSSPRWEIERDLKPGIYGSRHVGAACATSGTPIPSAEIRSRRAYIDRHRKSRPLPTTRIGPAAIRIPPCPRVRDLRVGAEGTWRRRHTMAAHSSGRRSSWPCWITRAGWSPSGMVPEARRLPVQALTLASIVEGAPAPTERPIIAAVTQSAAHRDAAQPIPRCSTPSARDRRRETAAHFADYRPGRPPTPTSAGLPPARWEPGPEEHGPSCPATVPFCTSWPGTDGTFSRTYGEHFRAIARSRRGR